MSDEVDESKVVWHEFNVGDIMRYFVEGFKPLDNGAKIIDWKWFYDPHLGRVVFRLIVSTPAATRPAAGAGEKEQG